MQHTVGVKTMFETLKKYSMLIYAPYAKDDTTSANLKGYPRYQHSASENRKLTNFATNQNSILC